MKRLSLFLALLMLAATLFGCGASAAHIATEPQPAVNEAPAEPVAEAPAEPEAAQLSALVDPVEEEEAEDMPEVVLEGTIEGTVLAIAPNDIVINTPNGNTISLMMHNITTLGAQVGDEVRIEYTGNILDRPEAVSIIVIEKTPVHTLIGTAYLTDPGILDIEISSKQVFGVLFDEKKTLIEGASNFVVEGDTVSVTYSGDLFDVPRAVRIEVLEAVPNRTNTPAPEKTDEPKHKTLDGLVKSVSDTKVTILTSKSNSYTFKINKNTRITGNYKLAVGTRITVYYDGYASKSPLANAIHVYAPPDPKPTPTPTPEYLTVEGYVSYISGKHLEISDGRYVFDTTGAKISGNSKGEEGDHARVTYYIVAGGTNRATYVTYTSTKPVPPPTPKPDVRTVTDTVTYFGGGGVLSLENGMVFDTVYANISGSPRLPGAKAKVTYYVADNGELIATKVVFSEGDPDPVVTSDPVPVTDDPGGGGTDPDPGTGGGADPDPGTGGGGADPDPGTGGGGSAPDPATQPDP